MTPTEQYNQELYHYGVKGMKWGVRKKYISEGRVERAAKKLANYKAKEASALNRFTNDITAAVVTNSLDNRRMKRRLNTSKRQLIKAKNRAEKQFNKMKKTLRTLLILILKFPHIRQTEKRILTHLLLAWAQVHMMVVIVIKLPLELGQSNEF